MDTVVTAQIARNHREGLRGEDSLSDGEGMLFRYEREAHRTFTMTGMDFGLDIVFLDSKGVIKSINEADPGEQTVHGTAQDVLEVRQGFCEDHGISVRDRTVIEQDGDTATIEFKESNSMNEKAKRIVHGESPEKVLGDREVANERLTVDSQDCFLENDIIRAFEDAIDRAGLLDEFNSLSTDTSIGLEVGTHVTFRFEDGFPNQTVEMLRSGLVDNFKTSTIIGGDSVSDDGVYDFEIRH